MPTYTKPWTFSDSPPNTNIIDADQVNENFDILYTAANTLDAAVADIVGKNTKGVWKTLEEQAYIIDSSAVAGANCFAPGGVPRPTGASFATFPSTDLPMGFAGFYLDPADFAVAGLTTQLRIAASGYRNGLSWGAGAITFGLYPNTGVGGAFNALFVNMGTIVSGSGVSITSPSALGNHPLIGSPFSPPAASHFMLGAAVPSISPGAAMEGRIALQVRHT